MSKSTKVIAGLSAAAMLGVAAMPFAGAFALDPTADTTDDSATVTINVTVDSAIALSLDAATVSTSMDTSDMDETMTTTATVSTNDVDGYALSVIDNDTSNALLNGSYHINAVSSSVAAGTEAWGIKGGDVSAYTAVPISTGTALTLKTHSGSTAADEATTFTYGVSTRADQETGTYTDTITYTAAVL